MLQMSPFVTRAKRQRHGEKVPTRDRVLEACQSTARRSAARPIPEMLRCHNGGPSRVRACGYAMLTGDGVEGDRIRPDGRSTSRSLAGAHRDAAARGARIKRVKPPARRGWQVQYARAHAHGQGDANKHRQMEIGFPRAVTGRLLTTPLPGGGATCWGGR